MIMNHVHNFVSGPEFQIQFTLPREASPLPAFLTSKATKLSANLKHVKAVRKRDTRSVLRAHRPTRAIEEKKDQKKHLASSNDQNPSHRQDPIAGKS